LIAEVESYYPANQVVIKYC